MLTQKNETNKTGKKESERETGDAGWKTDIRKRKQGKIAEKKIEKRIEAVGCKTD